MNLAEVTGHDRVKKVLRNAIKEDRVAHGYLFYGPPGIGKHAFVRAFAKTLLCPSPIHHDACGTCPTCRSIEADRCPDLLEVRSAGNSIKIEQIREIQRRAQFKSFAGERKVCVISQAEEMTREAANCLLKVLEEPPGATFFLLTAVNPYNLPATIVSRCQLIPLVRVSLPEIEQLLVNRGLDRQTAALQAALSDGLPGKALDPSELALRMETRDQVLELEKKIGQGDPNELLKAAEELERKRDALPRFFEQLLFWYRDRLVWTVSRDEKLILNIDKLFYLQKDISGFGKDYYLQGIDWIMEAKKQIDQNANLRMVLEVLLLRLAKTH